MGQETDELRRDIENTRAEMGSTLEAIGDRVSPGRIVQRRKNRMSQGVQSVRDRVMGTASNAKDSLTDSAGSATDAVKHVPDTVARKTEGAPLIAGGIAFGVGFLLAAVFPPSEKEKEASQRVMEKLEPAKEQLKEAAQEVAGNLKEPVMEAAQSVKETATESAQAVKDTAQSTAQDVKAQASQ